MLFAGDRETNVAVKFVVNELADVVPGRESWNCFRPVLEDAAFEVVGHADVEDAGFARHHVNAVGFHGQWREEGFFVALLLRVTIGNAGGDYYMAARIPSGKGTSFTTTTVPG